MVNFDDVTRENTKKQNKNCPQIPDYPYKIPVKTVDLDEEKTHNLI